MIRPLARKDISARPNARSGGPRPMATAGSWWSRPVRVGVMLGGTVGVIAVIWGSRGLAVSAQTTPAGGETRPVQISGDPLPRFGGAPDPAIGRLLPELRGTDFEGHAVAIIRDPSPKLLVCLAHWCPHCQRETPLLVAWLRKGGGPTGLAVYGVASGTKPDAPNYPPSAWLRREGWPRPVLADDERSTAATALGLSGYPFFVLVDAAGRVVERRAGELSIPDLEHLVNRARGG